MTGTYERFRETGKHLLHLLPRPLHVAFAMKSVCVNFIMTGNMLRTTDQYLRFHDRYRTRRVR